jgi:hypothetical protein
MRDQSRFEVSRYIQAPWRTQRAFGPHALGAGTSRSRLRTRRAKRTSREHVTMRAFGPANSRSTGRVPPRYGYGRGGMRGAPNARAVADEGPESSDLDARIASGQYSIKGSKKERLSRPARKFLSRDPVGPGGPRDLPGVQPLLRSPRAPDVPERRSGRIFSA